MDAIDSKQPDVPRQRHASGVYRRLELDRVLRSMSEVELKQALSDGTLDDLLDPSEFEESPLEF